MKSNIRCTGLIIVILLGASVLYGTTAPTAVAVFPPEQVAPAEGTQQTPSPPAREISLEQRADIYMARKNYADAADYYYRALKQASFKNAQLWNKLGIAYQQEGRFHYARKAYSNATRTDKTFAEAWNNLGTIYFMEAEKPKSTRKFEQSVKYYQKAIELRGDNATFHMNLGTSYYHLKKFDLAVQEYRTALGLDPNVIKEQSAVGTVLHASPEDVEYYFYMAKAFASVGNAEDAVRYLRRALEDGFNDTARIQEDEDFKKINQYPAFVELMHNPPVAIK
ncbi:MAG TPA: tetratricopeptide repeat protein [Terriglobia bacterium]|nr:tetratricopeptide repeat protein [Terriglobia bacterium]